MSKENARESEIIFKVLSGDRNSFSLLIESYKNQIFSLAFRLTGNFQESEDLAQETFIRAYSKLYQFNTQKNFFTWIYSISLNLIRNHLKKRNKAGFNEATESSIEANSSPERDLIESQESEMLQKCFNLLTDDFREIIVLKYYQGLTFADISEVLGISESAAKMRLYRGLEKLKFIMEKEGFL